MSDDCEKPICRDSPFGRLRKNLLIPNSEQCPLDRGELGRYSWAILHTFIAYYPKHPTEHDKIAMEGFLNGFKSLYPCTHCRSHFQRDYERDPPVLENHEELNVWACRQHNYVNKILGKAQFDCQYQGLMKRWKTGCDVQNM